MDWSLFLVSALAVPGVVLVCSGRGFRSSRAMSLGLCFAFVSVTSTTSAVRWLIGSGQLVSGERYVAGIAAHQRLSSATD